MTLFLTLFYAFLHAFPDGFSPEMGPHGPSEKRDCSVKIKVKSVKRRLSDVSQKWLSRFDQLLKPSVNRAESRASVGWRSHPANVRKEQYQTNYWDRVQGLFRGKTVIARCHTGNVRKEQYHVN